MPYLTFKERLKWFLEKRPDLAALVSRWRDVWFKKQTPTIGGPCFSHEEDPAEDAGRKRVSFAVRDSCDVPLSSRSSLSCST